MHKISANFVCFITKEMVQNINLRCLFFFFYKKHGKKISAKIICLFTKDMVQHINNHHCLGLQKSEYPHPLFYFENVSRWTFRLYGFFRTECFNMCIVESYIEVGLYVMFPIFLSRSSL